MIGFDAATLIVSWAAGSWFFLWITTRRRVVSAGYGWLTRGVLLIATAIALVIAFAYGAVWSREIASFAFVIAGSTALVVSIIRRQVGAALEGSSQNAESRQFPAWLDLLVAAIGLCASLLGAFDAGGPVLLASARILVGALFLGAMTDAMLLGHWYLVQPGLARAPLLQMVHAAALMWIPEMIVLLFPTGMISVLNGTIDDGYNGILGWFWAANAAVTVVIVVLARLALREREYSAVMAATGFMYLAILTGFAQDLTARILLSP